MDLQIYIDGRYYPEADAKVALLHEPRDDRVQWTLAGREHVRVLLVEREERGGRRGAGARP